MSTFFSLTDLGLLTDPSQLMALFLAYMQDQYPGYNPSPANLEYVMAIIFSSWASNVASQASSGATELFRQYGQKLFNLTMETGSSATSVVTVSTVDSAGYTLPSGTQFLLDNVAGFATYQDYVIPPGQTSISVTIAAVTPGDASNGLGLTSVALNQSLNWVLSVSLVSPSGGGVDPEDPDAYLSRLATTIRLAAPRPITASDYAAMALNFTPHAATDQQQVGRAAAIDGYNPVSQTYNNQRCVTVCATDSNGLAVDSDTMYGIGGSASSVITDPNNWGVAGWLQSLRELNFQVFVVSPTYTPVYVTVNVYRQTQYTPAAVQASVQSALMALLSPASWGLPVDSSGVGWQNIPTIYRSVVESTIQQAAGVQNIVTGSLVMGTSPGPTGTGDVALSGPFPLPTTQVSQIIVNVVN